MNSRAVIYARFSSHNQTEQSIEGQLRVCYEYAKNNDIDIMGEYIDRALTGTTDKRPQFQQMIDDSRKKFFNYVLVYQLDRFARNRYDSATYKAKLKKNNVKVISARENITDDASGILVEGILESMAEYYSVELAQKVKRGINENLIKGNYTGGSVILGYEIVDKKWEIKENEADIVRKIFALYKNGMKTQHIADNLNDMGLRMKNGSKFTINNITYLLRNKKYIGNYKTGGKEYNNIVPPIIDERTFKECNKIMDDHRHKAKENEEPYYLSGKLYCGYCNAPITAEAGTSKTGKVYHYYKCTTKRKDKTACKKKNINKEELENLVFDATAKYVLKPKVIDEVAKVVTDTFNSELKKETLLLTLRSDLKKTDYALDKLVKAVETGVDAVSLKTDFAVLEAKKNDLEIRIATEEAKLTKPLKFIDVKNFITYFANKKYTDMKEKKDFFNSFINRVILYDDKIIIFYNTNNQETVDLDNEENLQEKPDKIINLKTRNQSEKKFKRVSLGWANAI